MKKSIRRKDVYLVLLNEKLIEWGNGSEFQYPIFASMKEAKPWMKNKFNENLKIVPGEIKYKII